MTVAINKTNAPTTMPTTTPFSAGPPGLLEVDVARGDAVPTTAQPPVPSLT